MISLSHLTKTYGSTRAVDDITFEVQKGEILGFLGPNGAGKTTTMKVITCYMPPTEGQVTVADLDTRKDSLEIRKKIGYLPENVPIYQDMNVVDYLRFVSEIRKIPKDRTNKRIKEVVKTCGLEDVIVRPISELSKGYKQRVGLAQAIIHEPEVLILDEPTTGLDPNQIMDIRKLIKDLGKEKTVILSTHIMQEVQAICSRVLIINKGKIVADGTPEALQSSFQGNAIIQLELKADGQDIQPKLKAIDRVTRIKRGQDSNGVSKYSLEVEKGATDVREKIFRLAVENKWVILELHREQTSLEDIFRELTMSGA